MHVCVFDVNVKNGRMQMSDLIWARPETVVLSFGLYFLNIQGVRKKSLPKETLMKLTIFVVLGSIFQYTSTNI